MTDRLRTAIDAARIKRTEILQHRKQTVPVKAESRYLFISVTTGDKLTTSSVKTAKNRIDKQAKEKAEKLDIEYNHFWFHDIKGKPITDTIGKKKKNQDTEIHQ